MASSSRLPSRSRNHNPLVSEVFRPKLPLDPFSKLNTIREPWTLKIETVLACISEIRREVILVLGAPSLRDLGSIVNSQQLASSLLILATHQPPVIPASVRPAVCVLHLTTPLAVESTGAVRLVNLLECAERIGRIWRKQGGSGVRELSESENGLDPVATVPCNLFRATFPQSSPPSPLSSPEILRSSNSSYRSSIVSSPKILSHKHSSSFPVVDPMQRPFDVILNFLPQNLSDKSLLKQSILITTISRPYLVAAKPVSPNFSTKSLNAQSRRRSLLRRSSTYTSPPTPAYGSRDSLSTSLTSAFSTPSSLKAHLVHLLPLTEQASFAQEKLINSMESFQLSFSQPTSMDGSQCDALERASSFIMPVGALRDMVHYSPSSSSWSSCSGDDVAEWSIADLVLSGSLDQPMNTLEMDQPQRAWISSAMDFAFTSSDSRPLSATSLTQPSPTFSGRERKRDSGVNWNPAQVYDDRSILRVATPLPTSPEKVHRHSVVRISNGLPTPPNSDESESD
ncbi:hypothetical protein SERLADRAFT_445399, partial [Serpula lacrymans var. lacrymans S7.9]